MSATANYSLNGAYPAPLPERFITPEGRIRTSPEQWTDEELAEWGFMLAPAEPEHDPTTQIIVWETDHWQVDDLPPPPEPETVYRPIDKVEAMQLIRIVTGMTPEQELAFRDDPNLALFWRIWREDVSGVIHRGHPLTEQILNGVQAAGYLTPSERAMLMAGWPTA